MLEQDIQSETKNSVQIITVVNNIDIFNDVVKQNDYMNRYHICMFDNTVENRGIPERYNNFIDNLMQNNTWLIFCHQDFSFLEDPYRKLIELDRDCIYGPIGVVRRKGLFIRSGKIKFFKKIFLGQISQSSNAKDFYKSGSYIAKPKDVDTVDCCCLIVHSSLMERFNLRFDENLKFHLYAEDFSLNARFRFGIKTKAVQMECTHASLGNASSQFHDSLRYLKMKYKNKRFVGTCFD